MGDTMEVIFVAIMVPVLIAFFVFWGIKQKKYRDGQRENNTDKRDMLDLMANVMEGAFENYSYVVGYYTKVQQHLGSTTYYYFPYILAFAPEELIIFPFIKKEGRLYVRNQLPVNFSQTELKTKTRKNGVTLNFKIAGEKMPINVDAVIKSDGTEKSDKPLCVFQEAEYEKLLSYLPKYESLAKKA